MCNPNTTPKLTTISVIDHQKITSSSTSTRSPRPPSQTHFYFDLLSLPTPLKVQENPKENQQNPPKFALPSSSEIVQETKALFKLSFPIAMAALILYARSILSMLFLGQLGDIQLAAGSLAMAFANITGYSVLSGLALGMEPLCSQAFGAQLPRLLSLTLQRYYLSAHLGFAGWHGFALAHQLCFGHPSCVSVCLEWWWYEIMIVLCGLLVDPKATVASMGVLIQTTSLLYIFPSSLSFAVSTRVGNELGANRPERARVSSVVSIFIAGLMGLSAMGFATSLRDLWARMFIDDGNILRLTSAALPILGLCELGNCPQTVGCGVVRGTARPSTAANVNLGAFYLVGMPVAIGLVFGLGVGFCGLWLGLLSAQVCCAGLMLYVVAITDWKFEANRAQFLTCEGGCGDDSKTPPPPPPLPGECDNEIEPLICVTVTSS